MRKTFPSNNDCSCKRIGDAVDVIILMVSGNERFDNGTSHLLRSKLIFRIYTAVAATRKVEAATTKKSDEEIKCSGDEAKGSMATDNSQRVQTTVIKLLPFGLLSKIRNSSQASNYIAQFDKIADI